MIRDVLIAVLVLMLAGSLPAWPYSRAWGFYATGGIGTLLLLVILLTRYNVF